MSAFVSFPVKRAVRALAPLAAAILIALFPAPHGLAQQAWYFFAIFFGVVVGLVLEPFPGPVIGLMGVTVITILSERVLFAPDELRAPGFNAADRSIAWALSGFSSSTVWLAFSAFMFATGYEKTGLGRRIALLLVRGMGSRTLSLGYAITLADTILAIFTPSNTARSAGAIFPIVRNLPPLYSSQPNSPSARKIGAYIMWVAFATSCVTSSLFLTGLAPNLLAVEFIRKSTNLQITWLQWFAAFAPAGIVLLLALPVLTYVLYPPELGQSRQAPIWAKQELAKMGGFSKREGIVAALALLAILLWVFGGAYVHPTSAALFVVSLMLATGVVTWEDVVSNREAWKTLTLLATLVTLADGINRTGFVRWFAETIASYLGGVSPNAAIIGLVATYFFSHYMFASITAHVTAMMPIMLSVGSSMPGVPLDKLALLLGLTQGLMGVLTPYATGPAPVYANSGYITAAEYWRLGTIFGLVFVAALLGLSAPFVLWRE